MAVNPADWTDVDYEGHPTTGVTVGLDYAGVVVQIYDEQEGGRQLETPFRVGDRVCGYSHSFHVLHPEDGAFMNYILVKAAMQMRIPRTMTPEEAASLGVGVSTAGMGLPLPKDPAVEETGSSISGDGTLGFWCMGARPQRERWLFNWRNCG